MTEQKVKLTYKEKRPIADDAVHETFMACAKIITEKVKSLRDLDFEDSEMFYTQQRILNRLYVAFNPLVFKAAEELNKSELNQKESKDE